MPKFEQDISIIKDRLWDVVSLLTKITSLLENRTIVLGEDRETYEAAAEIMKERMKEERLIPDAMDLLREEQEQE